MDNGFWFAPETEESSFLGAIPVNSSLVSEVRVVRNIYRNEENGYSVYQVESDDNRWFKINGYFPTALKCDGYYTVEGVVKEGKHGRVLQVSSYCTALPQTEEGIITILRTLPRLDTRAPAVYQALGPQTLEMILKRPEEVAKRIKGVGMTLASTWQAALRELKEGDVVLQVLQDYKIPVNAAKKLMERYPDIIERLKRSPYFLSDEIRGFSFLKCDKIALANDYPFNGTERLQQAMLYVLGQAGRTRGDCYMTMEGFLEEVRKATAVQLDFRKARSLLNQQGPLSIEVGSRTVPIDRDALTAAVHQWQQSQIKSSFFYACEEATKEDLQQALRKLLGTNRVVVEEGRVYLGNLYHAEVSVARCLKAMKNSEYSPFEDVESVMSFICRREGVTLEEKQEAAILRFCANRGGVFILNGRAGCGKTFTLNIIIKVLTELYRRQGQRFTARIMAPTGKAAQVAHNSTDLPACTVHKALHLVADTSASPEVTINGECVVIDEFSMMGLGLSAALLRAVAPGVKVIIMGDFEQLPSIDPGNVLHDIIKSGVVPVITLDVVKRQAEGSGILYNANQILEGHMIRSRIIDKSQVKNNAYIFRSDTAQICRDNIVTMVSRLKKSGYSLDEIQVLCPQKKTDVGIDALNYAIQAVMNPPTGGKELMSKKIEVHDEQGNTQEVKLMFREGDKVIHTANNYDMKFYCFKPGAGFVEDFSRVGIVNGETGRIAKILEVKEEKTTHQRIYVRYGPDQYAMYEDDWDSLSMAYAMTIHRAQGSQWPVIIAPIMYCNKGMLNRKLFYTLYTRAQEASIIYCTASAVEYAIQNNMTAKRNTWLKERLQDLA